MHLDTLHRWAYRLSAALALAYAGYVVVLKLQQRVTGGPLGDVGEFLLVLACVTAFGVGLFADEARRAGSRQAPSRHPRSPEETPP